MANDLPPATTAVEGPADAFLAEEEEEDRRAAAAVVSHGEKSTKDLTRQDLLDNSLSGARCFALPFLSRTDVIVRLCLVGDGGAGSSSFCCRF